METIINGLKINYSDSGGDKPALLFLHGWAAPITAYPSVLVPLEQKYRVVAFDMPGVGLSDEPLEPLTLEDYVSFTLSFAQAVEIKECAIVCHSHGGRIAVSLMSDANCPIKITNAVFIDAAGVPPHRTAGYKAKQRVYKGLKVLGTSKFTAPLFGELYESERDKRSSDDYKAATPVMRKTLSNVVSCDLTPLMPKITAPVLLIWGENDTATPLSAGQTMESLIKTAGLAVIKNAGHFPFVDNPAQFSAVMSAYLLSEAKR